MRWVALLALLANMLLAVWYVVIVRPAEQRLAAPVPLVLERNPALPEVRLLAELDEASRSQAGVHPYPMPAQKTVPPDPPCLLIGPVPERVSAVQLRERFQSLGLEPDFRLFSVELPPVYAVYLPAYGSEQEAREVLRGLRAAGIDSFYIQDGDLRGGISLGVFSQADLAQALRAQRLAEGYPALVRTQVKTRSEIWVGFRDPGPLADEDYWRTLVADFPGLSRRTVTCVTVVSAEQLF